MNEHLFLGDSTYPHLAKSTNENICGQLRELSLYLVEHHAKQIVFAIDRIEQLERELAEAQSDLTNLINACSEHGVNKHIYYAISAIKER